MSTSDVSNISFLLNKPLDTTGVQYAQEESTVKPEETTVPVGQPAEAAKGVTTPIKGGEVSAALTGSQDLSNDFTNNLTNVSVPHEIEGQGFLSKLFGNSTNSTKRAEMPTREKLASLQAQVDSGKPLDDKQFAELSTQFDALLADQPKDAQTTGKAMEYLSSHAADCVDANGNFKLPDDFKDQPKEVQAYILKTYNSVAGGQEANN
ncbi:MAG: hypothetical protein K6A44_00500 [bacterium]|nr:hypothetical protein [bacterium]